MNVMTLTATDPFADVAPEGPFYFKPDRATPIRPHFDGYSQLSEAQQFRVNEVAQGKLDRFVVQLAAEEILVEHRGTGSVIDELTQQRLGYTVRRRAVAPELPREAGAPSVPSLLGSSRDAAAAPSPLDVAGPLRDELHRVKEELQHKQREAQQLRIDRDLTKVELEKLRQELAGVRVELQAGRTRAESELLSSRQKVQEMQGQLERERDESRRALEAARNSAQPAAAKPDVTAELQQVKRLAQERDQELKRVNEQRAKLQRELEGYGQRNEVSKARERELQDRCTVATADLERVRRERAGLEQEMVAIRRELGTEREENRKLRDENEKLSQWTPPPQSVSDRDSEATAMLVRSLIIWLITLLLFAQCIITIVRH